MAKDREIQYLGLDLGTTGIKLVYNGGKAQETIPSYVTIFKDSLLRLKHGGDVFVGQLGIEKQRYIRADGHGKTGYILNGGRIGDMELAKEALKYAINKVGADKMRLVVAIPVEEMCFQQKNQAAGAENTEAVKSLQQIISECEKVDACKVISQVDSVAESIGVPGKIPLAMIGDLGGGNSELKICFGDMYVEEADYRQVNDKNGKYLAGNWIDELLCGLVMDLRPQYKAKKNFDFEFSKEEAQALKEAYGFVDGVEGDPILHNFQKKDTLYRDQTIDVYDAVKNACTAIVEPMADKMQSLAGTVEAKDQPILNSNMYFTGRLAQLKGLTGAVEKELAKRGVRNVKIQVLQNPNYAGAVGAYQFACECPEDKW